MATGSGIATADAIYAGLAAFGVSALSSVLVSWQTPLRLVGGVVLVVLGIRVFLRPAVECAPVQERDVSLALADHGSSYASAVVLTLTNPMTIMAFGAIFASAGLVAAPGTGSALVATLGVGLGSFAWWLSLVSIVAATRRRVGPRVLVGLNRVSGGLIVAFGIVGCSVSARVASCARRTEDAARPTAAAGTRRSPTASRACGTDATPCACCARASRQPARRAPRASARSSRTG